MINAALLSEPALEPGRTSRSVGSVSSKADLLIKETRLMTETAVENEQAEQVVQAPSSAVSDEQLVAMLVDRARNEGLQLSPRC
jgi:hypothetical protein